MYEIYYWIKALGRTKTGLLPNTEELKALRDEVRENQQQRLRWTKGGEEN